jgi:hypothetical protein
MKNRLAAGRTVYPDTVFPIRDRCPHPECDQPLYPHRVVTTSSSSVFYGMDWPDYLRDQAAMYRRLAEQTDDPVVKKEMLELAAVCDDVADSIEDHLTGG